MAETTEQYRNRINQLKTSIENEPYIKEMREDIAEGIYKTGNRQADIEEQFQEVIDNTTGKDVIAAPELIAARNGEASLKTRLDKEKQEVTAQLSQTMTQTEFDSWIATLLDGGPSIFKETYEALVDDLPNGSPGVALVRETNPPKIYVWNGTIWDYYGEYTGPAIAPNAITTEKIAPESVTGTETNFLKRKSPNLLNKISSTADSAISLSNGQVIAYPGFSVSNYIPVKAGRRYIQSSEVANKAFYDQENKFILSSTNRIVEAPLNAAKIRITYPTINLNEMLVEGSTLPSSFTEYDKRFVPDDTNFYLDKKVSSGDIEKNAVEPTNTTFLVAEETEINLLNPSTVSVNKAVNVNGTLSDYTGFTTSDFIPVEPGKVYITSENGNKAVYDSNKANIKESFVTTQSVTIPSNGKYIKVSFPSSKLNTSEMVIEGSVFPEKYTEYGVEPKYTFTENIELPNNPLFNFWNGKKSGHLGDSLTQPNEPSSTKKYFKYLEEELNMTAIPYGVSSSSITAGAINSYQPMCERYLSMSDDLDLVTVFGGTNDYGRTEAQLGSFYSSGTTINKDTSTFYGALHVLFEGLIKKYAARETEIIVITPLQRIGGGVKNTASNATLEDYVDVLIEVAKYYGLPVLDLFHTSGLNPSISEVNTKYFADGLHPNDYGQNRVARRLIGFLKTIA